MLVANGRNTLLGITYGVHVPVSTNILNRILLTEIIVLRNLSFRNCSVPTMFSDDWNRLLSCLEDGETEEEKVRVDIMENQVCWYKFSKSKTRKALTLKQQRPLAFWKKTLPRIASATKLSFIKVNEWINLSILS